MCFFGLVIVFFCFLMLVIIARFFVVFCRSFSKISGFCWSSIVLVWVRSFSILRYGEFCIFRVKTLVVFYRVFGSRSG